MLRRRDLVPGMVLKNTRSGLVGVVRGKAEKSHQLMKAYRNCVRVLVRPSVGVRQRYRTWSLENVERANVR